MVYTIAPSPVDANVIWAGTDTGRIFITRDGGKTWNNLVGRDLQPWSKISMIEASPFDAGTAYAAVDRHRLDDYAAAIYRTRDFGKSWRQITAGISAPAFVRAVREDPKRKGLLYAATELGVYVSFNDGDNWLPLQLNLPVAPVHDLVVHDDDLVIATHGRSFWILDDLTPLRQISRDVAQSAAYLFAPQTAMRVRSDVGRDTPLPPEEPAGENPPAGAILDYYLGATREGSHAGNSGRQREGGAAVFFGGQIPCSAGQECRFPELLVRAATESGNDCRRASLRVGPALSRPAQPAQELRHLRRVRERVSTGLPRGPLVLPGKYQVRMTVDGKSLHAAARR